MVLQGPHKMRDHTHLYVPSHSFLPSLHHLPHMLLRRMTSKSVGRGRKADTWPLSGGVEWPSIAQGSTAKSVLLSADRPRSRSCEARGLGEQLVDDA